MKSTSIVDRLVLQKMWTPAYLTAMLLFFLFWSINLWQLIQHTNCNHGLLETFESGVNEYMSIHGYEHPLLMCLIPSHSCLQHQLPEQLSCSAFVGEFGAPSKSRWAGMEKRYSLFCKEVQSQTLTESWSTAQKCLPNPPALQTSRLQAQRR